MQRREFLLQAACTVGASTCLGLSMEPEAQSRPATGPRDAARPSEPAGDPDDELKTSDDIREGDMLYRIMGRTGERISVLGLGGYHIGTQPDPQTSIRLIRHAVDHGVTFMDNCWDYNKGASEERMGQALRDGYRDRVFLMTKIDGRTKEAATKQLEESLKRLQTDRIDLVQHHEIIRLEDPDRIFAENGAQAALRAAQKAGKVRYLGFTGHKDPFVHLRMLDVAAEHGERFDAVQMPLNVMDPHFRSFRTQVLPRLVRDGIGVLAMKSLGGGAIVKSGLVTAPECWHYAMTLPSSTVITGMEKQEVLDAALEAVRTFKPLKPDEIAALLDKTRRAAAKGEYERFKTTMDFDSTARHPEWLG